MQEVTKASNSNLSKARAAKNDEFYTRLEDIEREAPPDRLLLYMPKLRDEI